MRKKVGGAMLLSIVLSAILIVATGCGADRNMDETSQLEPVEVRDYEGEKLSSINDFRENSIKGPQHVDTESYRLKMRLMI